MVVYNMGVEEENTQSHMSSMAPEAQAYCEVPQIAGPIRGLKAGSHGPSGDLIECVKTA
jgi:hypothetical protein